MKGLQDLDVDSTRAAEECSTQYKGTGSRGGHWYDTPGKAKNASIEQPEIPAFVTLSGLETEYMDYMRPTRTRNNTKSAAQQNDDAIYNYLITQQFNRKDSVDYVPPNLEMEKLVEQIGRELNTIHAIKERQRLKSAGKNEKEYNPVCGFWRRSLEPN